ESLAVAGPVAGGYTSTPVRSVICAGWPGGALSAGAARPALPPVWRDGSSSQRWRHNPPELGRLPLLLAGIQAGLLPWILCVWAVGWISSQPRSRAADSLQTHSHMVRRDRRRAS